MTLTEQDDSQRETSREVKRVRQKERQMNRKEETKERDRTAEGSSRPHSDVGSVGVGAVKKKKRWMKATKCMPDYSVQPMKS